MTRWLMLGISLFLSLGARAAALELPAMATIRGETILLGEVAKTTGTDEECTRLNALALGAAPAPGQSRALTLGTIRARLRQAGVDPDTLVITGAESIKVSRSGVTVNGEMIVSVASEWLKKQFPADGIERAARALSTPATFTAPEGALALECAAASLAAEALCSVTVTVKVDDRLVWRGIVTFKVQRLTAVLVTRRALQRGAIFKESDVVVERRELSSFNGTPFCDPKALTGLCATRSLAAGSVLTTACAMPIPLVKRDSPVRVRAVCGAMIICLQATALADGGQGALIRVRNMQSRQEFLARVTGPDEVALADAPAEGATR
ncbi:MAG: flagellar basal body P-ring formation chaperone FlgA [Armatimonadota bacterium]